MRLPYCRKNFCTRRDLHAQLEIRFDEQTELEDCFDYLYIYDKTGEEIGKYTGTEAAGKTITVSGDTVLIRITSDRSGALRQNF